MSNFQNERVIKLNRLMPPIESPLKEHDRHVTCRLI